MKMEGYMSKAEQMVLLFFAVANYSVWVGSLAMMGLGTWMLIDPVRFDTLFADDDIKPVAAIIVSLGFLLFLNGFFGCCGALQRSKSCLLVYVTVMLLITLGEIIVVILSMMRVDEITLGSITTGITNSTIEDDYVQPTTITNPVDYSHQEITLGSIATEITNSTIEDDYVQPTQITNPVDYSHQEITLGSLTAGITNSTLEDDYIQPTTITNPVDYNHQERIVGVSLEQRNMAIFMGVLVGVVPFEVCAMIFSSLMIYANKKRNECC